ncbi:MAG: hypothetical protein AB1760_00170 [Pseudomonadota bacterium]
MDATFVTIMRRAKMVDGKFETTCTVRFNAEEVVLDFGDDGQVTLPVGFQTFRPARRPRKAKEEQPKDDKPKAEDEAKPPEKGKAGQGLHALVAGGGAAK